MPKQTKTQTALTMLKEDHQGVKDLFSKFEKSDNRKEKQRIVAEALMELKLHASVEEEFFYPALRQYIDDEQGLLDEADEEHHVAKILIAELEQMNGDEGHWEAKFKVLAESVRHHIKEEEGEIFPQARKTDIDFEALGEQMSARKKSLKENGVPPDSESEMISEYGLRGDSPARKARETLNVPIKAA